MIAVIGAGFAGLAAALKLSDHFKVTLFDAKGVGAGASGAACGLLHPYPGEHGRVSWEADEAMEEARALLHIAEEELGTPVASYTGILKEGACIGAIGDRDDVERLGENKYFIKSGITVFTSLYCQGLLKAFLKRGGLFKIRDIQNLDELAAFDQIIIATGVGIKRFPECSHLKLSFVKGQALTCRVAEPLSYSISGKRSLVMTEKPHLIHLGSTYERDSLVPTPETAIQLLKPDSEVLECRFGIRVMNPAHYFPIIEQVSPKAIALTAFGSRGLLYHGLFAKKLLKVGYA
jgi:glycine/D-amino acid oxidase-like deaminating enzyme